MPGPTIKYQKAAPAQGDRLSLRINGISTFLANPHSVIESKKVEIGGVQWYAVAKTFVENGTTYLAYYLRGTKDGDWRRWLSAQIGLRTPTTGYSYKLLPNEMRTASAEDAYAEWGCDTFISKELLSLHSPVFEQLFKERVGEKEIALQDNDLMGLLHFLCVIYPPHEKLNADKFVLAEELNNNLFDWLVWPLDKLSLKALASNVDVDVQLRDKVVEHYFRLHCDGRSTQPMALNKVLFAQQTKDKHLMERKACKVDFLTLPKKE